MVALAPTLAVIVDGRWLPGIGDATPLGWLTVAHYALASIACYFASRRDRTLSRPWLAFSALLVLLTVNKTFDVQSWFTQAGRRLAQSEAWHTRHGPMLHGPIQAVGVAVFAFLGVSAVVAVVHRLTRRGASPAFRVAAAAMIYQVDFVVIRAISLHAVDRVLGITVGPFRLNHVFELAGLSVVTAAALVSALAPRPRQAPIH